MKRLRFRFLSTCAEQTARESVCSCRAAPGMFKRACKMRTARGNTSSSCPTDMDNVETRTVPSLRKVCMFSSRLRTSRSKRDALWSNPNTCICAVCITQNERNSSRTTVIQNELLNKTSKQTQQKQEPGQQLRQGCSAFVELIASSRQT